MSLNALALDLSTWAGYAIGRHGSKPTCSTIRLPPQMWRGARSQLMKAHLRALIEGAKVEHVIIEDVYHAGGRKKMKLETLKDLHSWRTAAEMAMEEAGLTDRNLTFVSSATWRKTFGIPTQKPKGAPDNWLKKRCIERCVELGWAPKNDNEADALAMWAYGESLFEPIIGLHRTRLFQGSPELEELVL